MIFLVLHSTPVVSSIDFVFVFMMTNPLLATFPVSSQHVQHVHVRGSIYPIFLVLAKSIAMAYPTLEYLIPNVLLEAAETEETRTMDNAVTVDAFDDD